MHSLEFSRTLYDLKCHCPLTLWLQTKPLLLLRSTLPSRLPFLAVSILLHTLYLIICYLPGKIASAFSISQNWTCSGVSLGKREINTFRSPCVLICLDCYTSVKILSSWVYRRKWISNLIVDGLSIKDWILAHKSVGFCLPDSYLYLDRPSFIKRLKVRKSPI